MTKLDFEWKEKENRKWLVRDSLGMMVPADDAPESIKRSYRNYCHQKKAVLERQRKTGAQIL